MARLTLGVVLAVALLACASFAYAARDTQLMRNWHPMFIAPLLGRLGFPGHENVRHEFPVRDGALVRAPVTSCWNHDPLERDCDGPDHYKALVEGSRIGAYKGAPSLISPKRAKACATTADHRRYCVEDWRDDGKTEWLNTHRRIVEHALVVGCPGPHFEYPCKSKD